MNIFQKCIAFTLLLFLATGIYLLGECRSYIPYARVIWDEHGKTILVFIGILFTDITCVLYIFMRWLLLHETGRKLVHYEKQLSTGDSVSEELVSLLREQNL